AFQESETRFRDFVSVSTDSVWETDENNRYVFLSRDINAGYTLDMNQILGKKRWEVEGVDQEYGDWEEHWNALANRKPFRDFVFRRVDTEGRLIYWTVSGKPRFDTNGEFCGYRGSSADITSEVEAQAETKKIEEKLRQSQKLEIVGQLTGGVAHDFNNLLSVVMGNLELIEEKGVLQEKDAKHLSDAIKGAERGAELTHQLLAYSRQQTLSPTAVQPSNVIWEMSNMLERVLGGPITLKTFLRDNWPVLIDPAELENALLNLAINAKDAMPSGGELIIECFDIHLDQEYVEAVEDLKVGDYVCVVVADTGEGIPEEIRGRVLEPFFTTKEVGQGSGLGLSMVYGFVKQSGGHISIYSEMGQGTSIQLYLPRAFVAEEQKELKKPSELKIGNGELVLVVEDNLQVRQLVVSQLKSLSYETMECEDGPTALSILENEPIDMLLSDVTLPLGLNGLDIINFAQEQYQNMPKLLMSGFTGDAIRNQEDLPDNVEILYKPFTKVRLSEALDLAKKQRLKQDASVSTEIDKQNPG
ncbi:MAG: response regulator, partial [Sneathiella sp.]|nr:response regulator [Sneathiella sp.]